MNPSDSTIAAKMLKLYVVLLVLLAVFVYMNPVSKKQTLY